jgi:hypothetical protein
MPSPVDQGASEKQAEPLGLPAGFKIGNVFPFGGINLSDSRLAIADHEFSWLENYLRIGKGRMRTAWDIGPALYTAPAGRTIVSFYWFNIGPVAYCAVFLDDGTAVQVGTDGTTTPIGTTAGQFYQAGGILPACCPWGSQYLLIATNLTANSYWVWDGTLLYGSGGVAPTVNISSGGSGYTSVPTVTAFGGAGSGATFVATIENGSVVQVVPTSVGTGYGPADVVQLQFSGGGTDGGAILEAVLSAGSIANVIVTNGGSAYTSAPTVALTGGGGTGATAVATITSGKVTAVAITDGGSGYTGSPTVVFSGGAGSGATGVSVLTSGTVASVNVISGGANFTGTPTLTFVGGGGGSGAVATAVVTAGAITSVSVTNGGSGYTLVPSVQVQSGINNAASATVDMMPIGISGSAIETFQSRAWLTHPFQAGTIPSGGSINITAPESFTDFATSDGGLLFQNSDRFLRAQYTTLRQSNGYLYTAGDSSVGVISNVQTAGSTATTTFNALNVDPQTGSSWRDSCQDYARTILFANPYGVFGVYGGSVTKVSKKLDPLFTAAIYPPNAAALTPSAAVANMFSQRIYLLLLTITDPFTGGQRNVMVGWDETDWSVFSQSAALTYIGTQEINSNPVAWGTDGTKLMPLFNAPSATLNKTLQTKYFGGDSAFTVAATYAIYLTAQNMAPGQTDLTFTSTTVDAVGVAMPVDLPGWMADEVPQQGGSFQMSENPISFPVSLSEPATFGTATDPPVAGSGLGLTLITSAPDYELMNLQLGYIDVHGVA